MATPNAKSSKPRRRDTDDGRAERKRIQDRLAQRATRERTKNRIAYLEQRLSSLEAGDKQGEIAALSRIIDNLRNDNHRLRNALVKMRTTIDQAVITTDDSSDLRSGVKPCGCAVQSNCTCAESTFGTTPQAAFDEATPATFHGDAGRQESASTDPSDVIEIVTGHGTGVTMTDDNVDMANPEAVSGGLTGLEDFFDFNPDALLEMFEFGPTSCNGWHSQTPSPFDYRFPSSDSVTKIAPDVDKWDVSNGAFIGALNSVKKQTASTTTLDLHVPFKAAIWGWDNVGPEALHPVWNALRQVDQRVFGTWTSKAQRIALMYVCQTLIQYRENPTQENLQRVPVFLRPRPSQEKIQHPAVIDFLIWPGLRDRLVFEHEKYTATGAFSAAFVEHFNFHWPYSDREIFAYNPVLNRYEVSKIFLEYAHNFRNWTMKPAFFKKFPEMQHDIAAFEETLDFPRPSWSV
ncbi:uncharacterized protein Z518_06496 [Rhinocladiella mackenziei CBS 650.93]|uniref:Rhinocladiella mackenziei CBS 650.93 unplaced genomic scaffold supercont1.5, whole genome shotgun sequence n=1 Tax=Rhinocladiella mackenziei CBS 650.93 TaxID=1442369 RepID=A0A0D2II52_9EURO|nr:uncharacterized protein Z518_06496 [Rhinocladiella mackenziei CBS 650.93]KIX02946.1 hypothetical protein Z518_06496 [Rhinocladiella mackenziei CBS 650.93]